LVPPCGTLYWVAGVLCGIAGRVDKCRRLHRSATETVRNRIDRPLRVAPAFVGIPQPGHGFRGRRELLHAYPDETDAGIRPLDARIDVEHLLVDPPAEIGVFL